MTKQELRQLIRQRKQQHSVDESGAVTARLRRDPHYTHARTLLLDSALPDEVQTQPRLDELLSQGKNNIDAWWITLSTFGVLALTLLLLTLMGDALRDALDPRHTSGK